MATVSLIIGQSGSGKSASLRNFKREDIIVFSLEKTRLPFRNNFHLCSLANEHYIDRYDIIRDNMAKLCGTKKVFVIDDADYLMLFEVTARNSEKSYSKWGDISARFVELKNFVNSLPDDVTVYYIMHAQQNSDGRWCANDIGKFIKERIGTIEAMFENVFFATIVEGKHVFETNSDGDSTAKTSMEMFNAKSEHYVDNDLKAIDERIREYYGIPQLEEIKAQKANKQEKGDK